MFSSTLLPTPKRNVTWHTDINNTLTTFLHWTVRQTWEEPWQESVSVLYSATGPKASPTSIHTTYSFSQKCRFHPENGFRMERKLTTWCSQPAENSDVSVMHSRLSVRIRKGFNLYCLDRRGVNCKASENHWGHCLALNVLLYPSFSSL
jgi:hypothetical protein